MALKIKGSLFSFLVFLWDFCELFVIKMGTRGFKTEEVDLSRCELLFPPIELVKLLIDWKLVRLHAGWMFWGALRNLGPKLAMGRMKEVFPLVMSSDS